MKAKAFSLGARHGIGRQHEGDIFDVRRFCYYQGDYFSVMNLPDGSIAVYANGTYEDDVDREPDEPMPPSGEPIIVPFEVLPKADRNGIKIK